MGQARKINSVESLVRCTPYDLPTSAYAGHSHSGPVFDSCTAASFSRMDSLAAEPCGPLHSLLEMICQELVSPAARIVSCLGIVLRPMPEHHSAGLEDFDIEGMVSAGIGDKLDGRVRASPVRHCPLAIAGGRPIIEFTDENERRYAWTGADHAAPRIKGDGRAKAEIVGVDEGLTRARLRHRQRHHAALRATGHGYTMGIDEWLPREKQERAVRIERAREDVDRSVSVGRARMIDSARCEAIYQQDDVAPRDSALRRSPDHLFGQSRAAMQCHDRRKR